MRHSNFFLVFLLFLTGIALSAPRSLAPKSCTDIDCTGDEVIPRAFVIPEPVIPKPVVPKPITPPKPIVPKPTVPKPVPQPANGPSSQLCKKAGTCDWNEVVRDGATKERELAHALDTNHEIENTFETFSEKFKILEPHDEQVPGEVASAMMRDGFSVNQIFKYQIFQVWKREGDGSRLDGFFCDDSEAAVITHVISKPGSPYLSEILTNTMTYAAPGTVDDKLLKFIYLPKIANPDTQAIMRDAVRRFNGGRTHEFTPGTPGFQALLASPNGRIVPYMLIDHAETFGKTIEKIRVDLDQNMMIFNLKSS